MDISFMTEYVSPLALATCVAVGYMIKQAVPSGKVNKFIPLISGVLGIVITSWCSGWDVTPDVVTAGLISGLAATGLYEAFKNLFQLGKE